MNKPVISETSVGGEGTAGTVNKRYNVTLKNYPKDEDMAQFMVSIQESGAVVDGAFETLPEGIRTAMEKIKNNGPAPPNNHIDYQS